MPTHAQLPPAKKPPTEWDIGAFGFCSRVAWNGTAKGQAFALDVHPVHEFHWQISDENGLVLFSGSEPTAAEAREQADQATRRFQEALGGE